MAQALGGFGWQSALPGKFMSSACSQGELIVFLFLPFAGSKAELSLLAEQGLLASTFRGPPADDRGLS